MQISYGDIVDETELPERFLAVVSRGPGKLYIQEYVRNVEMSLIDQEFGISIGGEIGSDDYEAEFPNHWEAHNQKRIPSLEEAVMIADMSGMELFEVSFGNCFIHYDAGDVVPIETDITSLLLKENDIVLKRVVVEK